MFRLLAHSDIFEDRSQAWLAQDWIICCQLLARQARGVSKTKIEGSGRKQWL